MPRKPKAEVIGEIEASTVVSNATNEVPRTEFEVLNRDGEYVRTYTLELHGENAEALAHQFAGKIGGSVQ